MFILEYNVSQLQKKKTTVKLTPIVTFVGLQSHAFNFIRNNHYKCSHLIYSTGSVL